MIEQPKKALLENFLNTFYCKYAEISIYYEKFCPRDWSRLVDSKLKWTPLAFKLPYAPDQSGGFCITHALLSDSKLEWTPLAFKLPYAPDQSSDFCMTHALHLSCI